MLAANAADLSKYQKLEFGASQNWIAGQQKEPGDTGSS
jgi:hypothetical protein